MIYNTDDIVATYWPKERFAGEMKDYHKREAVMSPVKRDGMWKRHLPDTVIHTGAVEDWHALPGREVVLLFKSGLCALQVFKSERAKRLFLSEVEIESKETGK